MLKRFRRRLSTLPCHPERCRRVWALSRDPREILRCAQNHYGLVEATRGDENGVEPEGRMAGDGACRCERGRPRAGFKPAPTRVGEGGGGHVAGGYFHSNDICGRYAHRPPLGEGFLQMSPPVLMALMVFTVSSNIAGTVTDGMAANWHPPCPTST